MWDSLTTSIWISCIGCYKYLLFFAIFLGLSEAYKNNRGHSISTDSKAIDANAKKRIQKIRFTQEQRDQLRVRYCFMHTFDICWVLLGVLMLNVFKNLTQMSSHSLLTVDFRIEKEWLQLFKVKKFVGRAFGGRNCNDFLLTVKPLQFIFQIWGMKGEGFNLYNTTFDIFLRNMDYAGVWNRIQFPSAKFLYVQKRKSCKSLIWQ